MQTRGKRKSAPAYETREIWAADCETDPFLAGRVPRPFIWGARLVGGSEYRQFLTVREFLAFFTERECLVYAHNGGKFDWHFLLDALEPWQPLTVINGRLAKFKIGAAEFRDSYNIMPMPLSAYKKDEVDYSIFEESERHKPENWRRIEDYLRSDCQYLSEMLAAFIDEFGLHLTQAGASMKAWERITGEKAPRTSKAFYQEIAPFYYGGRVQCFHTGEIKTPFRIVDINSAYPFAMMHKHPYGDTIATSQTLPVHRGSVERSFITLAAKSTGAFPMRGDDGSLVFPDDGQLRAFCITGWEYLAALETGHLHDAQILEVKQLPLSIEFSAYLNHFYKMKTDAKAAGDKARYEFSKRFLNSLYGKTGANPENYEEFTIIQPEFIEAAEQEDDYAFAAMLGKWALVARPLLEEQQRYYNVAIAASVTGFVRAYDWRAICAVRANGASVYYMDTDCLWTSDATGLELHPDKLGAWDIEADCDYGAIAGKKLYAARTVPDGKWKTASKGVRLSAADIVRVATGETVKYVPDAPTFSLRNGVGFTSRTVSRRS